MGGSAAKGGKIGRAMGGRGRVGGKEGRAQGGPRRRGEARPMGGKARPRKGGKDYGLLLLSTPGIVGVKESSKHGG